MENTLSIVKPDAVSKNVLGKILDRFESAGLKIIAIKMLHLDKGMAEGFYAEHKGKPFFEKLIIKNIFEHLVLQLVDMLF